MLSIVAERHAATSASFAGTIEPRYSASLAFRVLGRTVVRDVNAGDSTRKGARLAALDPVPFDLAVKDARAGLANVEAQLANPLATEKRYRNSVKEPYLHRSNWRRCSRRGQQRKSRNAGAERPGESH